MYPNVSGPHQRPTHPAHPAYAAQPRVTGPHPSGPHRVTGPQQAVPTRGTGPHQAPPRRPAPPAKQAGPKLVAAAVALAVLGGVGGWLAYDAPTEPQFQTVSYAGDNPFTSPVGADRPDVTPVAAGGERPGETPEMYTEDPAKPACDGDSLVRQLEADPAKAAAWADIQRITPAAVGRFISGLNPVVLRASTAVVDHSYADGTYQATPAVLAPGTAVFVNAFGQPTVKCYSGNPLTPGTSDDPAVTTVRPAAVAIASVTVHDVVTGGPISRPGPVDTTGTGPSTGGGDDDGNGGGKGGGDKGGGGTTPDKPITGTFEYNGDIALSNGKFQLKGGAIVTPPPMPKDATALPGGGWKTADGKIFTPLGVERKQVSLGGTPPQFVTPEGKLVDGAGKEIPLAPGQFVKMNYDNTVTVITNKNGTYVVNQVDAKGKATSQEFDGTYDPKSNAITKNGTITTNIDGSTRKETPIPGGGSVGKDNTPIPAPEKNALVADENVKNDVEKFEPDTKKLAVDPDTGKPVDPNTGATLDPATGKPIDPATGKPVDPATGKPVEDGKAGKDAQGTAAGTNTGVDPVDPPVVEPVPAKKVPDNTGVIVPPVDETAGSTTGTSTGTSSGSGSGSTDTSSGTTSGSGSGGSTSTGSGEGGDG